MAENNYCFLCEEKEKLINSHITPKFVINWIKKTSITGGLRNIDIPNRRLEDGVKKKLLCKKCEIRFSKYEDHFAKKVFYPYLNGDKSFKVNELVNKFISSISWRILVSLPKKKDFKENELNGYLEIEKKLRHYLLDKIENPYDNYLFFFNDKLNFKKPTEKYFWYINRANHMYWTLSEKLAFVYFSFPKMFFVTQVNPQEYVFGGQILFDDGEGSFALDGKSNLVTKEGDIKKDGLILLPQTEEFILDISEKIIPEVTDLQHKKIEELFERNKEKIPESESFKTFIESKEKGN